MTMDGSQVILAAHRGDRVKHPENTMAAMRSAVEFGVDMIETDVRRTKDGVLVLCHDRSAVRTTGVDRNIDEITLQEFKALRSQGEELPTVAEFIDYVRQCRVLVNWELKVYPEDFGDEVAFSVADQLIQMILDSGIEELSMVNSFSDRVLEHIVENHGHRFPVHGQGIGPCRRSHDDPQVPEEDLFDWCCMYADRPDAGVVDCPQGFLHCQANGILPCVCIKDTRENYEKALALGCRMFTTNDIYTCHALLQELGVR